MAFGLVAGVLTPGKGRGRKSAGSPATCCDLLGCLLHPALRGASPGDHAVNSVVRTEVQTAVHLCVPALVGRGIRTELRPAADPPGVLVQPEMGVPMAPKARRPPGAGLLQCGTNSCSTRPAWPTPRPCIKGTWALAPGFQQWVTLHCQTPLA